MTNRKFTTAIFCAIFFCAKISFAQNSQTLSLHDFLEQVKNQNLSFSAAKENFEAFELLKEKAKLVTAVNLFASTQTGFAEQNQALQIFRYNRTYTQNSQVGFTHNSSFGLSTKLYYSLNHITYKGLNTSGFSNPELARSNYQSVPTLEMNFALWQNRFGALTRASSDAAFFASEAQKLNAKSVSLSTLVDAEKSYWNLIYAHQATEIQALAVKSAQKIFDYASKKEKMNLGEKGDVLQARALLESKNLSLKLAQNNEKIAARNFNKYRYIDSDIVSEKLENIDAKALQNFLTPRLKSADRFDVKAQEAQMKASVANAKIEEENNKPALNLYGSYAVNQVQASNRQAVIHSFDEKGRNGYIGVKLTMPINFGLTSDIRAGAVKTASAAKITYRQKLFEQENDWQNLLQNLATYKENFRLASMIEETQKLKLENERKLLRQGRTSTYQVLLFEQDYSNSQLTTQEMTYKLLSLIADLKLYGN